MTQEEILEQNDVQNQDDFESASFAWPTVVSIVVTRNPGSWLEECLKSIANQDYPDLTTLVVDVGSDEDLSERVAQALPTAFVRRSQDTKNFAEAVNQAIASIEGATYFLICHDDVIIGPGAIEEMVEEAFRSNASIVGPKIIDASEESRLLEVGGMIDRFGVPFSGIEPEEVDQGQHDGVRDVFYVSSAAMLVRSDLFRAIDGFDPKCFPGAEDIDLAWRAHLVNARVLVQPDAVIKHHLASDRQRKSRVSTTAIVARHRMRAVLKNASAMSLIWVLPAAFILHTIEGIVWLFRGNPKRSWLLFSGWIWNTRHLKETRKARIQIQKTREVSDRTIATFQAGGSSRVKRFFTSVLHNRQLNHLTQASRAFASEHLSRRTRETPIYLSAMFVYFIAMRSLFFHGIASVGGFVSWPSFTQQLNAILYGSVPVSSDPSLSSTFGRLIALICTALTFTNEGLAQTLFSLSLIPIGAYGVRLLLKERDLGPRSISFAAIGYGTFALVVYSFSVGEFGAIVMMAALPYFLRAIGNHKLRQAGLSAATMIAFYPAAIVVCTVISIVYVFAGEEVLIQSSKPVVGNFRNRIKTVFIAGIIAVGINIGLVLDALRNLDRNIIGFTQTPENFSYYLFSQLNVTIAFYVAIPICICALIVSRVERTCDLRVLVISASILTAIGYIFTLFAQPIFDVSSIYIVIQLAAAIALGVSMKAFDDEMKLRSFGLMHFATVISAVLIVASSLLVFPVLKDGTFGLPARSWINQVDAHNNERILYIGDAEILTGTPVLAPLNRTFTLGASEPTLAQPFAGSATSNDDDIRDIYTAIMNGETTSGGYLFNQIGIGSIVMPSSLAPDSKIMDQDQELLAAFDRQRDLARLKDRSGLVVYTNINFSNSLQLNERVDVKPPAQALQDRANGETEIRPIKESYSLLAILTAITSGAFVLLAFMWPRRHQLLMNKQYKRPTKPVEKIIDLQDEHQKEQVQESDSALDEKQDVDINQ